MIVKLKTVDSTNSEAFRILENHSRIIVVAETQTNGYGRNGSRWRSVKGNIHLSIGKVVGIDALKNLSAKVVCELFSVLKERVSGELKIKWPNDILLNGKKVAGILIESKIKGKVAKVVVGIGINYSHAPIDGSEFLKDKVSLSKEELESLLIERLKDIADKEADSLFLHSIMESNSYFKKGDLISLNSGNGLITGIFKGYGEDFAIVVETKEGECFFYSGEVKKIRKN